MKFSAERESILAQPMTSGRPKKHEYPANMTVDTANGRWIVRNPVSGKRKRFATEDAALSAVERMVGD